MPKNGQAVIAQSDGSNESKNKATERDTDKCKEVEFVGVERQAIKRIFLGGVNEGVSAEKIAECMKGRNINPTYIRLMQSKRKGTTSIRINIAAKDFNVVKESAFWPDGVSARPWLSLAKWQDLSKKIPLLDSPHRSITERNSI